MGRKIFIAGLMLVLFCQPAQAIPSEGNSLPDLHATIWGVQLNHIFLRDFNKVESKASTTQYFIKASYALAPWFYIDGKVGLGNVQFKTNDGLDLDFKTGFAGGYGFRILLHEDEQRSVKSIFGFQHISCHPFKETINETEYRLIWDEWQGTWLFIKEWPKTALYVGPQYSAAQLKYKVDNFRRRLKGEDCWGVLFGAFYRLKENFNINAEIRLIDEVAVNAGIYYKF